MSSYETSSLTEIEAVLDGLTNATSAQVYDATRGYSPKALASVAASRADAAGGGMEFPSEWTVGDDGSLEIATNDPTGDDMLVLQAPAGYHQSSGDGYLLHMFAGDGTDLLSFDPSGALFISSAVEEGTQSQLRLIQGGVVGEDTLLQSGGQPGGSRLLMGAGGATIFLIDAEGRVATAAHSAPADVAVPTGMAYIWFDQTNGAAKLMVKAKQANGTVVQGEVALSP